MVDGETTISQFPKPMYIKSGDPTKGKLETK